MKLFALFTMLSASPIESFFDDVGAPEFAYIYNENGVKEIVDAYEYEQIEAMLADFNEQSTPDSYTVGRWDTSTTKHSTTTTTEMKTTTSTTTTSTRATTTTQSAPIEVDVTNEASGEASGSGDDTLVLLTEIKSEKLIIYTEPIQLSNSYHLTATLLMLLLSLL